MRAATALAVSSWLAAGDDTPAAAGDVVSEVDRRWRYYAGVFAPFQNLGLMMILDMSRCSVMSLLNALC